MRLRCLLAPLLTWEGGRLLNRSANSTPVHLGTLNTWLGPCEAFVRVQGEEMGVRKIPSKFRLTGAVSNFHGCPTDQ